MTLRPALLAGAGVVLAVACAQPIQVRRVDARTARRQLTSNVLTTGELSRRSHNLLYNADLLEQYHDDPVAALGALHAAFAAGRLKPGNGASLAELAFHHAEHGGGSPYYLAAALYAWAHLFPADPENALDPFNPALRVLTDLYNRGIAEGLGKGKYVDVRSATYPLPFGTLEVTLAPDALTYAGHQLYDFVPLAQLQVKGFETYYRWPGLGAPLAAGIAPLENDRTLLAPRIKVPVTAILRPSDLERQLRSGRVEATLELHPGFGFDAITVAGRRVPLESEPTAAFALGLAESGIWKREIRGFLGGTSLITEKTRLVSMRPYRPGLIPVVFVHGTASSAARWAEMYNELVNDPRIYDHFQFWAFSYETGNPIIYSAMLLREALQRAMAQLDPDGRDPALKRMVVIGHSQGGLLTKSMVVESGDYFWNNVSRKPLDQLALSEQSRELLRRVLFFHPLPFVTRVVFIATPHHGSYVAGSWLAHQAARLVRAPLDVSRVVAEVTTLDRKALAVENIRGAPTAVDNMTPKNRFVQTLAQLPIAPGVTANSIISVTGAGGPSGLNDGVVEYDSAHIEPVESELVVRSPHSCQDNPYTIDEVRRILLEHLKSP